jgi:hypothetical protein
MQVVLDPADVSPPLESSEQDQGDSDHDLDVPDPDDDEPGDQWPEELGWEEQTNPVTYNLLK